MKSKRKTQKVKKKMLTLEEHNEKMLNRFNCDNAPCPNGIACPKCGKELYDSAPMTSLLTYPPQKVVHCSCGFMGYRYE